MHGVMEGRWEKQEWNLSWDTVGLYKSMCLVQATSSYEFKSEPPHKIHSGPHK